MKRMFLAMAFILSLSTICLAGSPGGNSARNPDPSQYILLNLMYRDSTVQDFQQIDSVFGSSAQRKIAVGAAYAISYLQYSPAHCDSMLRKVLSLSRQYDIPVFIRWDGESYWGARPDLWNWWDPNKPGYNPKNKYDVEWDWWSPDSAVKIGWRNWGSQARVLPMPNLMAPRYKQACDSAMRRLVPIVVDWWHALPDSLKYLFAGMSVGWESAIGVNNWYYNDGNSLLNKPESDDPTYGLNVHKLPSRGVQAIGYAAVSTLGLAHSGQLTANMIAEVVRVHLEELSKICYDLGVPRDHIFTHCGGWGKGDPTNYAALNKYSCPGWSFYDFAYDPALDYDPMNALKKNTAPYWSANEWLYDWGHSTSEINWLLAIENTLSMPKIRYLSIYNWEPVRFNQAAVEAIRVATKFR